jgi:threonine synthase
MAHALKEKKRIKAFVLYPKGTMKGLAPEDLAWNGGNVYAVEVGADKETCYKLAASLFDNRDIVEQYSLTMANTANIGRLLAHTFCYFFAFTRLKTRVHGDIFFATDAGNYGSLTAGIYAWRFSLPVSGFITNCTNELIADAGNKADIVDSIVPLEKRTKADPVHPSNLERLEAVFKTAPAVLRGLVFPARISDKDAALACQDLFLNHGLLLDAETARAYAAAKKRAPVIGADDGVTVLVSHNHPAFSAEQIRHLCGEMPQTPDELSALGKPVKPQKTCPPDTAALIECLKEARG